jgi:uncharacterized protein (DUF1697 family)
MPVFVSLLRGINVGGARPLKMGELEELYRSLGLERVKSYRQSGNLVFRAPANGRKGLAGELKQAIARRFSLESDVLLLTAGEMKEIALANPFLKDGRLERGNLYVTFLAAAPEEEPVSSPGEAEGGGDLYQIRGKAVYLYLPGGYARTKLNNGFFERKLKLKATTRNWNTVLALVDLAANL